MTLHTSVQGWGPARPALGVRTPASALPGNPQSVPSPRLHSGNRGREDPGPGCLQARERRRPARDCSHQLLWGWGCPPPGLENAPRLEAPPQSGEEPAGQARRRPVTPETAAWRGAGWGQGVSRTLSRDYKMGLCPRRSDTHRAAAQLEPISPAPRSAGRAPAGPLIQFSISRRR